tara:strand:- start:90 stop:1040 length:951 start_codon:yes stop_codon:yes gene_type:complete
MKKLLGIVALGLLWCNTLPAKIINLNQEISLDIPEKHNLMKFDDDDSSEKLLYGVGEFFSSLDKLELDLFLTGPSNLLDIIKAVVDGAELEDLEIFQTLVKEAEKNDFYDLGDQRVIKWLGKELKKIVKKEKIDFYTYVFYANKKIDEIDDIELREFFDLHKNMDKSDLTKVTKKYKKYLTQWAGDGKTFLLNEEVSLVLKKFKLSKINNQVFLRSDFTMSYLHAMNIPMNLLISAKNDHMLLVVSECWVNCSKQTSKFEKMIKPLFSNNVQIKETTSSASNNDDLTENLKTLNELYRSGVLTKEEFTKAKEKILN